MLRRHKLRLSHHDHEQARPTPVCRLRLSASGYRNTRGSVMSQDEKTFEGQCYCGAVRIAVTGDAVGAGYCHCANCRSWSAGPVNAFTLWKPEAVTVTQGEDQIGEYHENERTYRQWCTVCGGHLLT